MKKMTLLGLACCALVTATKAQQVSATVNGVSTVLTADDAGTTGLLVASTMNKDLALGTRSNNGLWYSRLWVKFQSGHIGIGTNGPTEKLHVIGAGRFSDGVKVDGNNTLDLGFGLTKENSAGKICYGCFSPESLNIVGGGTTSTNRKVLIWNEGGMQTSGAVGIGDAPQMKLDVRGAGSTIGMANAAAWDHMYFKHDGSTALVRAGGAESGLSLQVGNGGSGGYDDQTYTDVMRLMPSGNVGIGTTIPLAKLDVRGDLLLEAGSSPNLYTGTGTTELNRYLKILNSPTNPTTSGLKAGGVLVADDPGYANPGKNDLVVKGSTRIGDISTPTGYKLYVQTGILTEKVKVAVASSGNWADHVFANNYTLRPLHEVEAFIKANKHLPGIPAAEVMVKEGNDLGATDAKLLEKIEELTLYLIEMKKEIAQLKQASIANPKQ